MTTSNNNLSNGFTRFGLHKDIMRGIQDAGFSEPRPIQAEAIAPAQEGRDVLGLAQTGTGKNGCFRITPHRFHFTISPAPHECIDSCAYA